MIKIAFYQVQVFQGDKWGPLPKSIIACAPSSFRKLLDYYVLLPGHRIKRLGKGTCTAKTIKDQCIQPHLLFYPTVNQLRPWMGAF